ncbi:MAG: hypothetical protein NTZ17_06210 [Phycisphaerae bacterium]|nr:hypothetical protein [Phycisphaerae bacterium]
MVVRPGERAGSSEGVLASEPRQLLICGVCRYSRAGESLTAPLARRFGLSLSGLTMARDRVEQRLRRDKKLRETWLQIEQKLKSL